MHAPTGQLTAYIDVAQIVLYVFWAFFAGLIYYLQRESKREGYPLHGDRGERSGGLFGMPEPKTYLLADGSTHSFPNNHVDDRIIKGSSVSGLANDPLTPIGDPMLAEIGPGAYAMRADKPDMTFHNEVKIVPMRAAPGFYLPKEGADPRGMRVMGADGKQAGTIADLWVDRAEIVVRYFEVALEGGKHVLLPYNFCTVKNATRTVKVQAILAGQFVNVPGTKHPEQITFLEEERVMAYYGAGTLYATPARAEPLL